MDPFIEINRAIMEDKNEAKYNRQNYNTCPEHDCSNCANECLATAALFEARANWLEKFKRKHRPTIANGTPVYFITSNDEGYATVQSMTYSFGITEYTLGKLNKDFFLSEEICYKKAKKTYKEVTKYET